MLKINLFGIGMKRPIVRVFSHFVASESEKFGIIEAGLVRLLSFVD